MRVFGRGWSLLLLGLALGSLGCKDVIEAPTGLAYGTNPAVYTVGTAITPNTPTHNGGAIDSYAVSPALPAGLNLNTTSGVLSGTPTAAAAVATYTVTATNVTGSTTASLSITVNASTVTITSQPISQAIDVGQTATFTVAATGSGTLNYQWWKDGVSLAGATGASYTTPAATLADSGSIFSVVVSDAFGASATSLDASLTVTSTTASGTFTATGQMAVARINHTATVLASGKVLVVGGSTGGASLASAELYDPATGAFTATGSLNTGRQNHTATLLGSGKVLIAGGTIGAGTGTTRLATAELYDPATGAFTLTTGSMGVGRSDHAAALLPGGKVLLVCGQSTTSTLQSAELYDPATNAFTATAQAPLAARVSHTATLLPSTGKVLVVGGSTGTSALSSAELYDPGTGAFTATGGLLVPRYEHTATLLPDNRLLVVGGADSLTAERYDPAAGTFSLTGAPTAVRQRGHASVLLSTGKVLVTGGLGSGATPPLLASADLFDPVAGTFAATGDLTVAREYHAAAALAGGKALLLGGSNGSFLATAEIYF